MADEGYWSNLQQSWPTQSVSRLWDNLMSDVKYSDFRRSDNIEDMRGAPQHRPLSWRAPPPQAPLSEVMANFSPMGDALGAGTLDIQLAHSEYKKHMGPYPSSPLSRQLGSDELDSSINR